MWLFTPKGFYSIVAKGGGNDEVTIRARVKGDLENLKRDHEPALKIIDGGGTDYRFRAVVPRRVFLAILLELGDEIDYSNFKDAVEQRQGKKRHDVYMRVWGIMHALQPRRPWKRRQKTALFDHH